MTIAATSNTPETDRSSPRRDIARSSIGAYTFLANSMIGLGFSGCGRRKRRHNTGMTKMDRRRDDSNATATV